MALTPIDLGSAPNDGTGDNLRAGGALINTGLTQVDTNETDIATNAADIVLLQANPLIQYKYLNLSTPDVTNSSGTVFSDTGLIVTITPILSTSKLIASFHADFECESTCQGINIDYEYSDDNFVTSTVLIGTNWIATTGYIKRFQVSGKIEIPNPDSEIKIKMIFHSQNTGADAIFKATNNAFMDVSEIKV